MEGSARIVCMTQLHRPSVQCGQMWHVDAFRMSWHLSSLLQAKAKRQRRAIQHARKHTRARGVSWSIKQRVAAAVVQVHPGLPSLLGCEMDLPKNYYPEKVCRKTLRERPEAARRQPGAL